MRPLTYILLSALMIMLGSNVHAQRTRNFEFDEVHQVTGECHYNRLRVIDARTSNEKLGHLKTGTFNRSADLVTAQPFDKLLSGYYEKMLSGVQMNDTGELVMVLHDILVQDRIGGREVAAIFFDADFFSSRGDKYYYLGKADTLYETLASYDVSEKLLKGAAYNMAVILSRFSAITIPDSAGAYTALDIQRRRLAERRQYAAYKAEGKMKRGVYYTMEQFLNNTPIDTPILVKEVPAHIKDEYTSLYYPKSRKNKKPVLIDPKDVFAISDGKRILCSDGRGYTEMTYESDEFYATQFFSGIECAKGRSADKFGFVSATTIAEEATDAPGSIASMPYRAKLLPSEKRFIPLQLAR